MHGFSARLTPSQESEIKKSPAHIAMHEEKSGKLFTTHSPQFMGLGHSSGLWNASSYGEGVIIGMIDSGVWPESESFNEKGMPAVPTRLKGKCQNNSPDDTPRDYLGHGTHTSSTAAGNHVPGASQFGYAQGVARGLAPGAHVATYKIDYFEDVIAIASLSEIEKGLLLSAPLGMMEHLILHTMQHRGLLQLVQERLIRVSLQRTGALSENEVFGKVVICDNNSVISVFEQAEELSRNGAAAGILISDSTPEGTDGLSTPSLILPSSSGALIKKYATEAADNARMTKPISPNILKPDIIAPGVDMLAAIPPIITVQYLDNYQLASDYALYPGTSMAAPHVAGVTTLLKAVHPEWSPAAIRSALMTTAYTIDDNGTILTDQSTNLSGTPLDYGAGHINPNKAMNPGLIYDIDWQGYVDFLCGLGYSDAEMKATLRQSLWNCSQEHTDINYRSFVAMFNTSSPSVKNFTRVLTNVRDDQSVYHAVVETTYGMTFTMEPNTLAFTKKKIPKQNFVVSIQT
ncbi:Detected protein of unknown function [Hibiscus syriacus]|uniref:Peptidase S8/S53 domain-containing protein n=1 Tax=Hibiscus syriacus TaxID=106335 RepID=A0A6A2XGY4_HIBSY|nr:Detected protein of unknown function [Hibiscus syriacus]